jgi:hypothetical protein
MTARVGGTNAAAAFQSTADADHIYMGLTV